MWVHVANKPPNFDLSAELAALRRNSPHLRITEGVRPPADAGYKVLVTGSPTLEQVTASPKLATLIVPSAGIPAQTRRLMTDFPHISVRSMHHNAGPTAELALGLVLAAARGLVPADAGMRQQDWTTRFVPPRPCMLLGGHRALVAGYGEIGRRVARGLTGIGMRVHATRFSATGASRDGEVEVHPAAALPRLLPHSRVLVLALPSNPDTVGLIGDAELAALPRPAVLVNVSRAEVVDESALYEELCTGELAAGLDVWPHETADPTAARAVVASKLPFHELPNVVLSPHRGGAFSMPEVVDLRAEHLGVLLNAIEAGK